MGRCVDDQEEPPQPKAIGVAYMLRGDNGASNTDPYATKPTPDNPWVVSGPHIMILPTDRRQFDAFPTNPHTGSPWVMWKGTTYAHIMVPTAAMPKAAAPAKSATKTSTNGSGCRHRSTPAREPRPPSPSAAAAFAGALLDRLVPNAARIDILPQGQEAPA